MSWPCLYFACIRLHVLLGYLFPTSIMLMLGLFIPYWYDDFILGLFTPYFYLEYFLELFIPYWLDAYILGLFIPYFNMSTC